MGAEKELQETNASVNSNIKLLWVEPRLVIYPLHDTQSGQGPGAESDDGMWS